MSYFQLVFVNRRFVLAIVFVVFPLIEVWQVIFDANQLSCFVMYPNIQIAAFCIHEGYQRFHNNKQLLVNIRLSITKYN